jgi:hypothetical protein
MIIDYWWRFGASRGHALTRRVRPAACRGWPASGPGRLEPGPWFLTGVSVETPGSSSLRVHVDRPFYLCVLPAVTVVLDAGGADTYSSQAILGPSHPPPVMRPSGRVVVDQVVTVEPGTGCRRWRRRAREPLPRAAQAAGWQQRGAAEHVDAWYGAAAPDAQQRRVARSLACR